MKPLTLKQQKFVAEYLVDLNATQAAIRCGYSKKTARQTGAGLMSKAAIRAAVAARTIKSIEKAGLKAEDVMEAIRRPIAADIRALFDGSGNLRPIVSLTAEEASLIAGFEVIIKNAVAGDGHLDTIHKVRLVDRAKYVEMGAKHFALLTDVVKHTTDDARLARLLAGRTRAAKK